MKLITINTSNNNQITVEFKIDDKTIDKFTADSKVLKSEAAIPIIDKLLKKNDLTLEDLEGIEVFEGPGSFTGLRVGISIANALGFLLKIPVNSRKVGESASPVYN